MPFRLPSFCPQMCERDMLISRLRPFVTAAVLSIVLLLTSASPALGQSNGEGSIYSRFGIGMLKDFSSSQSDALGGGAYALRSLNYSPSENPALWSDQVFTRLTGSANYRLTQTSNGQGESGRLNSGTVQSVQFSFPLYERTLGVNLSLQPYSRSNFKVIQTGEVEAGPTPPDDTERPEQPYTITFEGTGGLHQLRGGLGYRIGEVLSVGASVDLLFGLLESQQRTTFDGNPTGFRDAVVSDGTRLSGFAGTLGGHLAFADVFAEDDAFSIGASVTLPTQLSGSRYRTLDEDLARDTLQTMQGEVSLPWRGRLGVSYQPDERWTFVADGLFEPWSNFTSDFGTAQNRRTSPSRFPVGGPETLTDRWRTSVGVEVVPGGGDELAGYFARAAYRLGGYVERLYVRPDRSTTLRTIAATGGVSLPTSLNGTRIDINLTTGVRGTTSGSFVRDAFYGLSFHVNFGERWFQQRKLR